MPKASWNGTVIAEAADDEVQIVEGNVYFPPQALNHEHLRESSHTTTCPWKGRAGYYDVVVGGQVNENAAWIYREPLPAAEQIAGHVAFWRGVEVR